MYNEMVTLPQPLFNSIVAEVVRWNDVIRNITVRHNPLQVNLARKLLPLVE